ncbi:hypothetical protein PCANC_25459 [Puccinia coronata f. sp. avenae]|uniref:Integrase catalytic domain-containing protein n=1 Tax=Puccinia coronata f. sp. avenae TaxID=200324 RepID=A0A2N5TXS3_9BASI|nr:hypothetical protein PCANC_25459 [Puccinia coronata f. sp. avenae]
MNQEGVKNKTIVKALKNEAVCRESQNEIISVSSTKPKPVKSSHFPSKSKLQEEKPTQRCLLCNRNGHDLNSCNNIKNLITEHKAAQKAWWKASQQDASTSSSKPQTRAGRTSAAPLDSYAKVRGDEDDSDYSGSDSGVVAKNAVMALSTPPELQASGDPNLDSGCSMSMTPDLSSVNNPVTNNTPVHLADHSVVEASHKGTLRLPINGSISLTTLVVPSLHKPLLSIANLCDQGLTVVFKKDSCDIFSSSSLNLTGPLVGRGYCRGNLYYLPSNPVSRCSSIPVSPSFSDSSLFGYHVRFSHLGLKALKLLLKMNNIVPSSSNEINVQNCPVCVQTKMHRYPFRSRAPYRSTIPGQLIHSDVASYEVNSREGYRYFITFVDDYSKFLTVYPMKNKSDSFSCFKIFRAFFEKSGSHKIQAFRTDNGGEYLSAEFTTYLITSGIRHDPGPPHSPQLNGVAKRTNRTIHNFVQSSLLTAHLPKSFWVDALRHSLFPYNTFPCHTPAGFNSPASILNQQPVNLSAIHPFGCLTWYKVPEPNRKKLDPKARSSILLSYLSDGNGYRLWDLEKCQIIKSRDVVFDKQTFPYGAPLTPSPKQLLVEVSWPIAVPACPSVPSLPSPNPSLPVTEIKVRSPSPISSLTDDLTFISLPDLPPCPSSPSPSPPRNPPPKRTSTRQRNPPDRLGHWAKTTNTDEELDTPKSWRQVLKSPNKLRWLKAADEEYASLLGMSTWKLVPCPAKRKIIKSKWVFKIKRRPDQTIQKLKARLVAMGYSQVQGLDYDKVFSPTLRLETLRLILSLLGSQNWKGLQVDFKTAFLNGHLDKPVFMEQPPGFEDSQHLDWVCKVSRLLYGLKQSPRQWNIKLHKALLDLGLTNSAYDPTLYFKLESGKLIGAITTHVDNLAIVGEPYFVDSIISSVGKQFTIVSTPTDSYFKNLTHRTSSDPSSPGPYPQIIGSLLWISQCTRPDIAFAVNKLSQYLRNPSLSHWYAAVRILNYLKTTSTLKLRLGGSLNVLGYSDSDWAEDRDDRRSTSAYTYRIGDGAISWKSRKQATVSLSSTEAEYKALSDSCKEGAEALARNPEHHARTKHIHARYHFIRECIADNTISLLHVSTTDMLADMLTKPLARVLLEKHRLMFGIVP